MAAANNEFRVMTSGAFTAAYKSLIPQLEQLTGKTIVTVTTSIGTGDISIPNRLKRGEVADIVIVADGVLRQFIAGGTPDQATVLTLMERYGELDGEIVYQLATAFAQVNQGLSADQRTQLLKLRTDLLGDLAYPSSAYLYAQSIPLPTVPNTDFLFSIP